MKHVNTKAMFTPNVYICVCVRCQEWDVWQQMMVFTFNVSIFKKETTKIKEKREGRRYVRMYL